MALEVIGAGFGRTGTSSVREALTYMGHRCLHMADVLFNPAHKDDIDFWCAVAQAQDRKACDWENVLGAYSAVMDFPACAVWHELAEINPDAKVLLTLHPGGAEAWYQSTLETIYVGTGYDSSTEFGAKVNEVMDKLVWNGMLQGAMEDRDRAIARYNEHAEQVRDLMPADRLLVFSADQGWGPLCDFLGKPVPDMPFPRTNDREQMSRTMARLEKMRAFRTAGGAQGAKKTG